MSEPYSEEILSAYLDGELSADARSRIERWLETSADARARLADLRGLSGALRALPRESLSSEFVAQVLQQAERQMLLPTAAAVPTPGSAARRLRFWGLSAGAPLAAAALVVVAVQITNRPAPRPFAEPGRLAPVGGAQTTAFAARQAQDADASPPPPEGPAPKTAAASAPAGADGAPLTALAPPGAAANIETESADRAAGAAETPPEPRTLAEWIDPARQATAAGEVAVVTLYVVDRTNGMNLVQATLEEHRVPPSADDPTRQAADPAAVTPPEAIAGDSRPAGRRQALFVVADAETLSAALGALVAKSDSVGSWSPGQAIELDDLDPRSVREVEDTLIAMNAPLPESSARRRAQDVARAQKARSAPPSEGDVESLTPSPPSPRRGQDPSASALAAVNSDAVPEVAARQVLVSLGNPTGQRPAKKAAADEPSGPARSTPADGSPERARSRKSARATADPDAAGERRPDLVRVIILVDEQRFPAAEPPPSDGGGAG